VPKLEVDANGVVTTAGRFQGRHLDDVVDYIDGLEAAVTQQVAAPAAPAAQPVVPAAQPQGDTPAQRLAASAAARIDPLQQMTLMRLEQDDEAAFAATVTDYATYKEQIDKLKDTLQPHLRAQKNLHRTLYINVKSNDENVRKRIFEPIQASQADAQQADAQQAAPLPPDRRATPQAAPPMAAPTPSSRQPPSAAKKAKLIASDKIRRFCQTSGAPLEAYMLRLEEQGVTQSDIDSGGQLGRRNTQSDKTRVYDRQRVK
jgi:hypothetical protein